MNVDAEKARSIFTSAVEKHTPDEWDDFLHAACGEDAALRRRVELLLQAHRGEDSFLDRGESSAYATIGPPIAERPGTQIGPYKLLQQIGEGGFGVVYMAEQHEPIRRKVALKVIKPGMDTKEVVGRFEAERQALALMDHPNVAKVLDAGTTDSGRPYFVMELVRGTSITEFCDENNLDTQKRLELFIPVCRAIQHAHQKAIIHRDIKPSNVLVTMHDDKAVPKVIDFGIAKALHTELTARTVFTQFQQLIGTPAYMSPEQAQMSGLDIDTRCDVYALGVLLYELLTGATPFDLKELLKGGYEEICRRIREQEPPPPSNRVSTMEDATRSSVAKSRKTDPNKLGGLIRGDLDWIVMKAMEKDRTRRYETANGLAQDVECFLASEPVSAVAPGSLYRWRKFVRRNKASVLTATAFTILLIVGMVVSSWLAVVANRNAVTSRDTSQLYSQGRLTLIAEYKGNGDFNVDGVLNARDIDSLSAAIRAFENANQPYQNTYDITADRMLDHQDRRVWTEELARTFFGDSDLDGDVEFSDFLALSLNFGNPGGWAEGDFDGNGNVSFPDFLLLSDSFGGTRNFAPVPEPSPMDWILLLSLGIVASRRRDERLKPPRVSSAPSDSVELPLESQRRKPRTLHGGSRRFHPQWTVAEQGILQSKCEKLFFGR